VAGFGERFLRSNMTPITTRTLTLATIPRAMKISILGELLPDCTVGGVPLWVTTGTTEGVDVGVSVGVGIGVLVDVGVAASEAGGYFTGTGGCVGVGAGAGGGVAAFFLMVKLAEVAVSEPASATISTVPVGLLVPCGPS